MHLTHLTAFNASYPYLHTHLFASPELSDLRDCIPLVIPSRIPSILCIHLHNPDSIPHPL